MGGTALHWVELGLGEGVQLKSSGGVTGIMRVRSQRSLAP